MDDLKPILMTAMSVPPTVIGIDKMLVTATSVFGLISAICGTVMGICGVIYWLRKVRNK